MQASLVGEPSVSAGRSFAVSATFRACKLSASLVIMRLRRVTVVVDSDRDRERDGYSAGTASNKSASRLQANLQAGGSSTVAAQLLAAQPCQLGKHVATRTRASVQLCMNDDLRMAGALGRCIWLDTAARKYGTTGKIRQYGVITE